MKSVRSKMYIRIFLLMSIFFTLLVIPFAFTLAHYFSRYAFSEIDRFSQQKVDQTARNADFLFGNLTAYGIKISRDLSIREWLLSGQEGALETQEVMRGFSEFILQEALVTHGFLVNLKTGRVLDTRSKPYSVAEFPDPELLEQVKDSRYAHFFVHRSGGARSIALVVPEGISAGSSSGSVVLMLDQGQIYEMLSQAGQDSGMEMLLLDRDGEVLLGDAGEALRRALLSHDGDDPYQIEDEQAVWHINFAPMEFQGWRLYALTDTKSWAGTVDSFRQRIIAYSLVLLLILIAAMYWQSRRAFSPFSKLAASLQKTIRPPGGEGASDPASDEYKTLESGIDYLIRQVDGMQRTVRDYNGIQKNEALLAWLLQGQLSESAGRLIERETKLAASGSGVVMGVVRIESYVRFTETYNYASRKLLKFAMENIVAEIWRDGGIEAECVDLGEDHLVVLFDGHGDRGHALDLMRAAVAQIRKWLQIDVTAALGEPALPHADMRKQYTQIYELTQLKFLLGESKVYTAADHADLPMAVTRDADHDWVEKMILIVKAGQGKGIEALLDELAGRLRGFSYEECKFRLTHIVYSLFTMMKLQGKDYPFEEARLSINRRSTLDEAIVWLRGELGQLAEELSRGRQPGRKEELAEEITDYIRRHIHDPLLSIDQICGHLSISPSYIRAIFKEAVHTTVSDFIVDERIRYVKSLLEQTDSTILDIAGQSGFLSESHFYKVFKRKTGVTPSEYRKMKAGDGAEA
ncbi:AraC family transcriptional regulator [Cohnella sp. GCM10020058]|uniref:AraC family transcriptional regulator n=1 Tax=Cohnella sp. GCM10020058 TaxID=3317330 RepID=UPI0036268C96